MVDVGMSAPSLAISLPADLSTEALTAAIRAHGTTFSGPDQNLNFAQPDQETIIAAYTALVTLASRYTAELQAREGREADIESQLNEAIRCRAEAEERAASAASEAQEAANATEAVRQELSESQGELAGLRSSLQSGSNASAEVKSVLEKEQREKREILEVLDRERAESLQKTEQIDVLNTQAREVRKENSHLSSELQQLRSTEATAKFKNQSLVQELELARKDAEWGHAELTRVDEEHKNYRTTKHAQIVNLQAELETATQSLTTLQSKSQALQASFDENARRLSQSISEKQELLTRLASQEESFRKEFETKDRLTGLLEKRAEDSNRRVQQVEGAWEEVLQECREREEELKAELERSEQKIQQLGMEKQDLQTALDRLAQSVGIDADSSIDQVSAPATPSSKSFLSSFGLSRNAGLAMSPTAAMAASLQRSGKSFTEVYTALAKAEEALRREKLESSRLASVLDSVMAELHERAPALQAQREETERLAAALEELSSDFARACESRDIAERGQKQTVSESEALKRENSLLNQQLVDLGRQVRNLAREIIVRDDPSAASRLDDDDSEFLTTGNDAAFDSDTQDVITTQLVTFDSLTSLVAQNGRLLRVARELGARMEEEETKWRNRNDREEAEAVKEAVRTIERLENEVTSERARVEAVRRERDMFRSMLAGGGRSAATVPATSSASDGQTTAGNAALANQFSALQTQFDAFRDETARDTTALKDEARRAREEAGKNALAAAREKASREAGEERLRTLQQTLELQRNEVSELSKQLRSSQEQAARLENSSHSLSEDLLSARKELERLRHECANLRAERELAKGTEARLTEEIQVILKDKAGLHELLRNVQIMQNELDRNAGETKRHLESQLEKLEQQGKEARERLEKEESMRRELELRRDVETGSLQSKIEKATGDLANAREQLAIATTNVDHLTRRAEDLKKQVDSKEEKLSVYERRSGVSSSQSQTAGASLNLNGEQQLQIEVAELRGELRGAQVEAEQNKAHAEQFKAIAQASEEALNHLQSTYDEYKSNTESSVAQKDAEITQLRERLESVASEITTLQNEASTARQALEAQRSEFASEKRSLEDALAELGTVEERAKAEQIGVRADVEQHARIAREAQTKYEAELVAHANDIQVLSAVKAELDSVRAEHREAQKSAETAQANLSSSTVSWATQREALSKERDALQHRLEEVGQQNKVLHEHLENLTQQISQVRKSDGDLAPLAQTDGDTSISGAPSEELQEIVRYLRREKEIADLQLDLNRQEATRLRLSLEHTTRALDEAKLQIAEERERLSRMDGPGTKQHDELLEKINQLSILRESNTTLRDETERANRKVSTLQAQLAATQAEIDPLKEALRAAQGEVAAAQGQLSIVQEDNQRWQARAQSILAQYDRVDPEEIKRLEERSISAETRATEAQQQVDSVRGELANSKEQFSKLRTQATERIQNLRAEVAKLTTQIETLSKEKEELSVAATQAQEDANNTAALDELRSQLLQAQSERAAAQQSITAQEEKISKLEETVATLTAQAAEGSSSVSQQNPDEPLSVPESGQPNATLEEARTAWQEEKAALEASKTQLEAREKQHHQKAREFLQGMRQAQKERDELKKEKDEMEARMKKDFEDSNAEAISQAVEEKLASRQTEASTTDDNKSALERSSALDKEAEVLRSRIAELEKALESANARIAELEANGGKVSDDGTAGAELAQLKAQHAEELKQQQTSLAQQYQKRQTMAVEVAVKKAQAAAASSSPSDNTEQIEQQVQQRLQAFESERDRAQAAAIQAAVEAKEKELRAALATSTNGADSSGGAGGSDEQLKARYEAGYTAGKNEASLRNQLLIKQKDGKIAKLTNELAELKGETTPAGASPSATLAAAAPNAGTSPRGGGQAGARGGRGAAAAAAAGGLPVRPAQQTQQLQQQQPQIAGTQTTVRGRAVPRGASIRGVGGRGAALAGRGGRGGAQAGGAVGGAGGAQKRKASEDVSAGGGVSNTSGSAAQGGASPGGGTAKKAKGE